jgi:hypothetical protein
MRELVAALDAFLQKHAAVVRWMRASRAAECALGLRCWLARLRTRVRNHLLPDDLTEASATRRERLDILRSAGSLLSECYPFFHNRG